MIQFEKDRLLNGTRGGSPAVHPTDVNRQSTAPLLSAARFWNVASTSAEEGEITLYGDILPEAPRDWWTNEVIEGRYVTPEGFDEALAAVRNKKNVTVRINSLGGDLYTGIAIHDALKDLKAHVTVVVEGIAASAASVIAMAGDEIRVHPGDTIMIHGVSALLWNYYGLDDLRKVVRSFEAAERAIARIYAEKTGLSEERLRDMMSRETWMVGRDAVDLGFADTLIGEAGPGLVASADRRVLLVAGVRHDVTGLHLPEWIKSVEIPGAQSAHGREGTGTPEEAAEGGRVGGNAASEVHRAARGDHNDRTGETSAVPTGGAEGAARDSNNSGTADTGDPEGAQRTPGWVETREYVVDAHPPAVWRPFGDGRNGHPVNAATAVCASGVVGDGLRTTPGNISSRGVGDAAPYENGTAGLSGGAGTANGAAGLVGGEAVNLGSDPARGGGTALYAGDPYRPGEGSSTTAGAAWVYTTHGTAGTAGASGWGAVKSARGAGEIASGEIASGEIPLRGVETHTAADGGLNRIQTGSVPDGNTLVHKEDEQMTLEELRAQQPDLVAQIEAAAAENARAAAIRDERARLQAIEEIENTVGDANMIRDAKYGEHPMTAEQLALAALRRQAALGANVVAALEADTKEAKVAEVGTDGKVGDGAQADESPEAKRRAGAEAAKAALGRKN